jgi:hypothetical protein
MANPSFPDILSDLVSRKAITPHDASLYRANYDHFEANRSYIQRTYSSQWVASLNHRLYASPFLRELEHNLHDEPNASYAYIEQVS